MRSVGIKILKNRLSEYVRLAAGGETILVSEHDRIVAELVPPRADRSPRMADALLADAVRKGWVTPPVLPGVPLPPRQGVVPLEKIIEELGRDRSDR